MKPQPLVVRGLPLAMSLVSGCLPKDLSLSLARPRTPLPCAKAPSHGAGNSPRPTPHASLGERRQCRTGSPVQTTRGDAIHSQEVAWLWIPLSRVAKLLGTFQNAGKGRGRRASTRVEKKEWSAGVSYREERHLHPTDPPKAVFPPPTRRVELQGVGVLLTPFPLPPTSPRK